MKKVVRHMAFISWLASVFGHGVAGAADTLTVGPFTLEAVERKIGAGGFPNTSGNPFKRAPVTTYRVLHKGTPVVPPGTEPDRGAPWWEARVLNGAAQPAVLLMGIRGLPPDGSQRTAAPAGTGPTQCPRPQWQWLDAQQGQPGPVTVVSIAHRPGQPRGWPEEDAGCRSIRKPCWTRRHSPSTATRSTAPKCWTSCGAFYAAEKPMLAFSPGGTQFVVAGERDRPDEFRHGQALRTRADSFRLRATAGHGAAHQPGGMATTPLGGPRRRLCTQSGGLATGGRWTGAGVPEA